jgi:c-di-GMP-binding flagellar brake protein YcgR
MSEPQRRRWERYRKELAVEIVAGDGVTARGRTQDVCDGGLGVLCAQALEMGAEYGFRIAEIIDTPLSGNVRWCTPTQNPGEFLAGVEFSGLSKSQAESLHACMARWRSESGDAGDD